MVSAEAIDNSGQREAAGQITTVTTSTNPSNSTSTSSSLFSKFTRSPSRKHKPRPSSETNDFSATGATLVAASSAAASRVRPRPGYQRTTTAPAAPGSLNAINREPASRRGSEVVGHKDHEANAIMPSVSSAHPPSAHSHTLSKTLSAPTIPEQPNGTALPLQPIMATPNAHSQNPNTLYQHMHDMSSKRIATLDYMRKAHDGRTFWFNTVHFGKSEISKLPSYSTSRLARRATNYLLLGMSIPAVLDIHPPPHPSNTASTNANIAQDYLRSLNILLNEFESFQQLHPPDGSAASSLTRARLPQMFKRAAATSRPRKSSGAVAEIGLPLQANVAQPAMPEREHGHSHQISLDTTYVNPSYASSATTLIAQTPTVPSPATGFPTASAFPPPAPFDAPNSSLLPNEGPYTHLLTPPLPFAPDFYSVFATLCDVLIDVYQRLLQLLSTPAICTPSLCDMFSKADARVRKVMVGGIVREFETTARENAKRELLGVQKVVLGGLMGT